MHSGHFKAPFLCYVSPSSKSIFSNLNLKKEGLSIGGSYLRHFKNSLKSPFHILFFVINKYIPEIQLINLPIPQPFSTNQIPSPIYTQINGVR